MSLLAIVVGAVFGCILLFLLVAGAWARWGAIGALIFFGLLMAAVSYVYDRTHTRKYED